jgi:integrase
VKSATTLAKKRAYEPIRAGSVEVKLYTFRRGKRAVYAIASYLEKGKGRTMKQFADYDDAKAFGRATAERLAHGQRKVLSLTDEDAFIYERAQGILRGIGYPLDVVARDYVDAVDTLGDAKKLKEAVEYYVKHCVKITQKDVPDVVTELLESRAGTSGRHQKDLRLRLGRFVEDYTGPIGHLTQPDLALWLAKLGLSSRSHNNYRGALLLLFRFAQKRGYLAEGTTAAEKTEDRSDGGEGDIPIFTPAEMRRLLNTSRRDVLPYLALGAFAGVRTAEISRLDWSEINFDSGYIEIKKSKAKTKGRRLIKMQPNLVAWLLAVRKQSGPVTPLARPEKTAGDIVCKATGSKDVSPVAWKRNGLRHSYCTYRMAVIQNEHQVSAEMGNSAAMVYSNYRELATKEDGEAWFSIFPRNLPRDFVGGNCVISTVCC